MLVVISDLHFCDGTATPRNVSADAFSLLFGDIDELATQYHAKSIDLVLLGDVVDLLRTERWFEVRPEVRPWGSAGATGNTSPSQETLKHAANIAERIFETNAATLQTLRNRLGKESIPMRCIYLPGNHDRLYLHDETLRNRIRAALGAVDERMLEGEGVRQHALLMPRYGLVARHGHEWDIWNFGRYHEHALPIDYTPDDYLVTPIGDAITTELVARLPYDLRRRLENTTEFHDSPELRDVNLRMQRIEDVRPLIASFRWALYEGARLHSTLPQPKADVLRRELQETVRSLAADFKNLQFYQEWRSSFHKPWHLDAAERLDLILDLLERFDLERVSWIVDRFSGLLSRAQDKDECLEGAAREELRAVGKDGLRFVVYGHTHEPLQAALHGGSVQDIYLNSGTWRQRQFLAGDDSGFVNWDLLTYLVFVDDNETQDGRPRGGPGFLKWNGTRRVDGPAVGTLPVA